MKEQTEHEEKLNTQTHALGVVIGFIALGLFLYFDSYQSTQSLISVVVYAISFIVLFGSSTLYHHEKNPKRKKNLRIADHISIYFLIAGTYTPVLVITLNESLGTTLLYIVWGIALFGVMLKLFFTGKFEVFSTLLYLAMGWLIIFDISNLSDAIGNGIYFLVAGGIAYTLGIILYILDQIPYNHVIWHIFVLAGALFHFWMIYFYVI